MLLEQNLGYIGGSNYHITWHLFSPTTAHHYRVKHLLITSIFLICYLKILQISFVIDASYSDKWCSNMYLIFFMVHVALGSLFIILYTWANNEIFCRGNEEYKWHLKYYIVFLQHHYIRPPPLSKWIMFKRPCIGVGLWACNVQLYLQWK